MYKKILYIFYVLSLLFAFNLLAAINLVWKDNSENESGFIVQKKAIDEELNKYKTIAVLPQGSESYLDQEVTESGSYCYKVGVFNAAGQVFSPQSCIDLVTPGSPEPESPEVRFSHQFITNVSNVEIFNNSLYSFKSGLPFNDNNPVSSIDDINFIIKEGALTIPNIEDFQFLYEGNVIAGGYAAVEFSHKNSLSFKLNSTGKSQLATLFLKAGVWTGKEVSLIIKSDSQEYRIVIPKGYKWHDIALDIVFSKNEFISITQSDTIAGYSAVMFAGLIVQANPEVESSEFSGVNFMSNAPIDVDNYEYATALNINKNEHFSSVNIDSIEVSGVGKIRTGGFGFVDLGEIQPRWSAKWDQNNEVSIQLSSHDSKLHTADVYFRAGSWSSEKSELLLTIDGRLHRIPLPKNMSWHQGKATIEFTGSPLIELKPSEVRGGYSTFEFIGVTVK